MDAPQIRVGDQLKEPDPGFTILELVVVLAGLSILASLAIPNIARIFDFNNIDQAKALLNTAAADCLQKNRINDQAKKDVIDEGILSDTTLSAIGYKINQNSKSCSYLELLPTSEDDAVRFPIGFSVSGGKLFKFATPTSIDAASKSSCENWAGVNCKADQALKDLIAYRNAIEAAKKACNDAFTSNTSGGKPDGAFRYWNPSADSGCPTRPPKVVSNTCTTNGCNKTTYFCDGKNLFTDDQSAYEQCWIDKGQAECIQWQAEQRAAKTDNPRGEYTTFASCKNGTQKFWFCDGENLGDAENMNDCLIEKENKRCAQEKEERFAAKIEGKFSPSGSTMACQDVWYCFKDEGSNGNPYTSADEYNTKCKNATPPPQKCQKPWYCEYTPNVPQCQC